MSDIRERIPFMSIEEINNLRINAHASLQQPARYEQASLVLDCIDKELETCYLPGMIITFKEHFPGGFYGNKHAEEERNYKEFASQQCISLLGKDVFHELLFQEKFEELISRASKVVSLTNFIQGSFEKPKFLDVIRSNPSVFFPGLYAALWQEASLNERFEAFLIMLEKLKINKWTYATYFQFLSDPENNMFVKPEMIKQALEKSQYPLEYESTPSVELYHKIIKFCKWLEVKIQELKPRDMIDIHSFLWHLGPTGKHKEE